MSIAKMKEAAALIGRSFSEAHTAIEAVINQIKTDPAIKEFSIGTDGDEDDGYIVDIVINGHSAYDPDTEFVKEAAPGVKPETAQLVVEFYETFSEEFSDLLTNWDSSEYN
jgi:hypothetical protein